MSCRFLGKRVKRFLSWTTCSFCHGREEKWSEWRGVDSCLRSPVISEYGRWETVHWGFDKGRVKQLKLRTGLGGKTKVLEKSMEVRKVPRLFVSGFMLSPRGTPGRLALQPSRHHRALPADLSPAPLPCHVAAPLDSLPGRCLSGWASRQPRSHARERRQNERAVRCVLGPPAFILHNPVAAPSTGRPGPAAGGHADDDVRHDSDREAPREKADSCHLWEPAQKWAHVEEASGADNAYTGGYNRRRAARPWLNGFDRN